MRIGRSAALLGAVAALLLSGCGSSGPYASDAEVMCESQIRDQVLGSARFSGTTSIVEVEEEDAMRWRVSGDVEGTNALGGPASERFFCVVIWTEPLGYEIIDSGMVR